MTKYNSIGSPIPRRFRYLQYCIILCDTNKEFIFLIGIGSMKIGGIKMNRNFFVYGTLMTGCSNHHIIPENSIEKIQKATIENVELYSHISGEYPCLIEGNSKVFGEVITIKESHFEKVLQEMDELEDYDENAPISENLYNRELKDVILENGETIKAYVYMYNAIHKQLGKRIPEGNWRTWMEKNDL